MGRMAGRANSLWAQRRPKGYPQNYKQFLRLRRHYSKPWLEAKVYYDYASVMVAQLLAWFGIQRKHSHWLPVGRLIRHLRTTAAWFEDSEREWGQRRAGASNRRSCGAFIRTLCQSSSAPRTTRKAGGRISGRSSRYSRQSRFQSSMGSMMPPQTRCGFTTCKRLAYCGREASLERVIFLGASLLG